MEAVGGIVETEYRIVIIILLSYTAYYRIHPVDLDIPVVNHTDPLLPCLHAEGKHHLKRVASQITVNSRGGNERSGVSKSGACPTMTVVKEV